VNGWLLDTNVVAELAKSRGTVRVAAWAAVQDDALLFISILTLGEHHKGLHNVPPDSPLRLRIAAGSLRWRCGSPTGSCP
jgi:predicted nucleic acid-binding protein